MDNQSIRQQMKVISDASFIIKAEDDRLHDVIRSKEKRIEILTDQNEALLSKEYAARQSADKAIKSKQGVVQVACVAFIFLLAVIGYLALS